MNKSSLMAVMASSLALAACSSWSPSFDYFKPKPTTAMLTIESDPPGAEARTSLGGTCRTPCTQQVAVGNEFTVSYALNGYVPQTVTVHPGPPDAATTALLEPNPAFAQLQPATPPKPPPPPKKKKRPRPLAPPPTVEAAPPPATGFAPPPAGGFSPPPGAFPAPR
jgi:hypothetical protein